MLISASDAIASLPDTPVGGFGAQSATYSIVKALPRSFAAKAASSPSKTLIPTTVSTPSFKANCANKPPNVLQRRQQVIECQVICFVKMRQVETFVEANASVQVALGNMIA